MGSRATERIVRARRHFPQVGRRAAPHAVDGIAGAAFVDAKAAVDPFERGRFWDATLTDV